MVRHELRPGGLIVLLSDGFVASSRDVRDLLKVLKAALAAQTDAPSALEIKTLILAWDEQREEAVVDDRTLLVFQWQPAACASRLVA